MPWSTIKLVITYLYAIFNLNPAIASASLDPFSDTPKNDTITIGLLVDNLQDGQQAIFAAQLAINQSNLSTGKNGNIFKLAIRETDGPWGKASTMVAELIYEEAAVALIGALDGRTAHLAEQLTAKSQIPYIETHATDPTLSRAFVPWFFRMVPNDYQVSTALTNHIYEQNKFSRVAIISDSTYDGKMASLTFEKIITKNKVKRPTYLSIGDRNTDYSEIVAQLMAGDFQAIVLLTNKVNEHPELLRYLEQSTAFIYHNQLSVEQKELSSYASYTISAIANPSKYEKFNLLFQKFAGSNPTAQSIYVYDAFNILFQAIATVGSKSEIIGQQIGKMAAYDGISGQINFDEHGDLMRTIRFTDKRLKD